MCFIWMLYILLQWLFQAFFKCFYKCFGRMSQVFQLFRKYVANVSFECFKNRSGVTSPFSMFSPLLNAGDVRAAWVLVGGGGMGRTSRSSGTESERAGRGELCSNTGLGPNARALA
jgi:hypothetical protein